MRMKEDHMLNGQLKPAYNIQFASNGAFIVSVMGSQKSNDLHTLIPFLEQMMPRYGAHIKNVVADAGYESVENYAYLVFCKLEFPRVENKNSPPPGPDYCILECRIR